VAHAGTAFAANERVRLPFTRYDCEEEMNLKLSKGTDALLDEFDKHGINEMKCRLTVAGETPGVAFAAVLTFY
jgi:hypothetical protein